MALKRRPLALLIGVATVLATAGCASISTTPPSVFTYRAYMTPALVSGQQVFQGTPTLTPVAEVRIATTAPRKALVAELTVSANPGSSVLFQTDYQDVGGTFTQVGNNLSQRYQRGNYSTTLAPVACKHEDLSPCRVTLGAPYTFNFAVSG